MQVEESRTNALLLLLSCAVFSFGQRSFRTQQDLLVLNAAVIAGQSAVSADDAVTRDEDGDGICTDGLSDCLSSP